MEEMSVAPGAPGSAQRGASAPGSGPRDLRDWIARVEAIGQLKRISEEVGRDEEMGAITYMAHQEIGAPALLFERIKGSPKGFRSLWNPLGSSVDRFALAIGEPAELPVMELIQRKAKGQEIQIKPPPKREATKAPNLLKVLEASVAAAKNRRDGRNAHVNN